MPFRLFCFLPLTKHFFQGTNSLLLFLKLLQTKPKIKSLVVSLKDSFVDFAKNISLSMWFLLKVLNIFYNLIILPTFIMYMASRLSDIFHITHVARMSKPECLWGRYLPRVMFYPFQIPHWGISYVRPVRHWRSFQPSSDINLIYCYIYSRPLYLPWQSSRPGTAISSENSVRFAVKN